MPPRAAQPHIGLPTGAPETDQPLAATEHSRFGAALRTDLGGIGLELRLAILAPNDQADLGGGSLPNGIGGPGLTLSSVLTEDKAYQL
jgi:hypothetical protein